MKSTAYLKSRKIAARERHPGNRAAQALFCLLASACGIHAQSVITPPPSSPLVPRAMEDTEKNSPGAMQLQDVLGDSSLTSLRDPLFRMGPVDVMPHFLYRALYGDGVPAAPGQGVKTVIQEISPGVLLNLGDHWILDYTPTERLYSNRAFHDGLDENVALTWGTTYGDWVLGLSQSYVLSSTPLIETGVQTDQEEYATGLTGSYRFNSTVSLDLAVNQDFRFAEAFSNTHEWSTLDWLNYQPLQQLTLGLGAGLGYINENVGSDVSSEQLQARAVWQMTEKTSFTVHAGLEEEQFLQGTSGGRLSPVYGASLSYHPVEATALSIDVERTVTPSYFENQVMDNTSLNVSINQRLLDRLYLSFSGGYSQVIYISEATGTSSGRTDSNYSLSARLSTPILKRGNVALVYDYTSNASTTSAFSLSSSQVGLELSYRY